MPSVLGEFLHKRAIANPVGDQVSWRLLLTSSEKAREMESLEPSSTLVSAMKGGRAQNGTMQKLDLHVKWAPEVYDPPSTSMSHTVNHHQWPKAKKKDKCKRKGKSSRGNVGERKHGNRKSLINDTCKL